MYTWAELEIEKKLRKALKKHFKGDVKAEDLMSGYTAARKNLVEQILPEIKGRVPSLSDHGPAHVANVLKKI